MINLLKQFINNTLTKTEQKIALFGIIAFLITRLTNLTLLPIFTDEAIYIRWSEIAWSARQIDGAKSLVFIPLSDGKQPLYMWLGGLFMQFTSDHLWAGRLPAVLSGLGALIGIWLVAYELFKNKKIAWISSAIYFILPYTLLYDRMALADSMLTMWGIWAMYLSLVLLRTRKLKVAIALGIVYGLGLLTKSPALFYWSLAPLTLLFWRDKDANLKISDYFFWKWNEEEKRKLYRWVGLFVLAVLIGQAIMNIQRVSGMYHRIGEKNFEFLLTWEQFLAHPFERFYGNLYGMSIWLIGYLTIPLVICTAIGLFKGLIKLDKRILYLFVFVIAPWFSSAAMAKVLYPRYLLFFTPPILLIMAYGIHELLSQTEKFRLAKTYQHVLTGLILTVLFAQSLAFSYNILFNPPQAPFPLQDKMQYVEDWPSGYGFEEIYQIVRNAYDEKGKLAIGTEGTFGLMPAAFEIKFYDEIYRKKVGDNLFIVGQWPMEVIPQRLVELAVDRPAYFLIYQNERDDIEERFPLELVKKIEKPGGKTSMRLYKIIPQAEYKPNYSPQEQ